MYTLMDVYSCSSYEIIPGHVPQNVSIQQVLALVLVQPLSSSFVYSIFGAYMPHFYLLPKYIYIK